MKKIFLLKGLDCPNCAAEIEKEVGELLGVTFSAVNLMKRTLTVEVDDFSVEAVTERMKTIVHNHEPEVEVSEYTGSQKNREDKDNGKKMILRLIVGAVFFILGIVLAEVFKASLPAFLTCLIVAYVILGADIVFKAVKNMIRGRVFDENFLMSLSTLGAFIIGEYPEAVAVMFFYQIGEFFQDMSVRRSRRSIAELMDIRPDLATVNRKGVLITVDPEMVSLGEVIVVKPGEKIPLDGVITDGVSLLDTKALTGESIPRTVKPGDDVFSGCINQSGVLTIRVTKTFGESTVSKIIDLVENASNRKAPAENFITAFARYYTPIVVIFAIILAMLPPLVLGGNWIEWIRRGMVFLVISCPCALVVSIPLAFFGGIGAASKHGVLVKGSNYLETLDHVSTVVFDKTGTLTKGVFKVSGVFPTNGFTSEQVLEFAAFAESNSNHPIAQSVLAAYGKEIKRVSGANFQEIPGLGVNVVMDGKKISAGNAKWMETEKVPCSVCDKAGTKVYVAVDGRYAGCILIADEVKTDSKKAVSDLKRIGIEKTVLLTGDDEEIAKAVAEELGLDEYYAELLPDQKVEKMEMLDSKKRLRSRVAFVGDGINDAPVLARADVGVAMGALGSDAAIEAADIILMTDEPSKLVEAIGVAKATKRIVIQNIVFSLVLKGVFLVLGALGVAGMWEAVFGDVGVALIAVLNSMRIMKR